MAATAGYRGKIYYATTTTWGSEVWAEVDIAIDVNAPKTSTEIPASARADGGHEVVIPGLHQWEITATLRREVDDTAWLALKDAWEDRTVLNVAAMSGPIATAGSVGPHFWGVVTDFSDGESLDGLATTNITIKPTPAANNPEILVVP
jgi:hypothetical protein